MAKRIEVTVTVGDRKVKLEGPEDFVREEVERFANLPPLGNTKDVRENGTSHENIARTERDFVAEKQPHGHNEIVAVLAQFLTESGHAEFTPDDIRRAYIRARVRPPKVISQALRDAKNMDDYLQSGSKRGTFRLSQHGERKVLFDLPRSKAGPKD
jgi:hypothetical protein